MFVERMKYSRTCPVRNDKLRSFEWSAIGLSMDMNQSVNEVIDLLFYCHRYSRDTDGDKIQNDRQHRFAIFCCLT